ncbi:MAG: 50S ribosomal protein L10 [Candidatus Omnitrophica bacterium]|nr:50S ribosomal protein L10 [Candidatus Omnitrophota bacterium]
MDSIGKQVKQAMAEELAAKFANVDSFFVGNFVGIKVVDDHTLRERLRQHSCRYIVVKHTLAKLVLTQLGVGDLMSFMEGPTGLAFGGNDPVAISKVLVEFSKDYPSFSVRGGIVNSKLLSSADVEEFAKLPSIEVLRAQVLGGMLAPISGFVSGLQGIIRKFALTLKEIAAKKEAGQ